MTDTPLLRLARLMLRFVGNESSNDADSLNLHAALFDLVRDLEAAPPPEPARRTITREEFKALTRYWPETDDGMMQDKHGQYVSVGGAFLSVTDVRELLGLTVEDA